MLLVVMGEIGLAWCGQVGLEFLDNRAEAARGEKAWAEGTGLILAYCWELS
jgi:hypothetical protein